MRYLNIPEKNAFKIIKYVRLAQSGGPPMTDLSPR